MLNNFKSLLHFRKDEASYSPLSKDEHNSPITHPSKPSKSWIKPLLTAVTAIFSVLALLLIAYKFLFSPSQNTFLPNLNLQPRIWEQDFIYSAASSPESDRAWDALMPAGRGFVRVPSTSQKSLGPGIPIPGDGQAYAVSMFHQLHCLAIIRTALYNPESSSSSSHTNHHTRRSRSSSLGAGHRSQDHDFMVDDDHIGHCFDYLRQAIQCTGDMTLESTMPGDQGAVDGWGITHQCRNWDQAYKWTLENEPGGKHNYSGIL